MGHPTAGEEEYLETLYWLHEVRLPLTAANVARAMMLSAPTVHEMVKRLEADGLITRDERKRISFTDRGLGVAENVVSRHRLVERFLTDVLGIPWHEVHEEAERMEHAMSPAIEQGMRDAIGDATTCPHGHPIEVGKREPGAPLADVEPGAAIRVLRFENEAEQVLHYLYGQGVRPGQQGRLVERDEDRVVYEDADGERHALTLSAAETVSVKADPSPPERVGLPAAVVLEQEAFGR
ncbi:metal-dependent transcriptional regulator [Patulibacter brassicae]|uniref:Manganese transport regulator n=1 Tax=Patulibacter brassicae TaxID=1705717 RepID=A0ABU4VL63_9ACTN|nr:metal-dependent transcriptional regulator [Patulibacter brassicae]MDX8152528.1 metal-dependent transcriptional regulator [Patulibacter brassicae]